MDKELSQGENLSNGSDDLVSDDGQKKILCVEISMLPSGGQTAYRIRNSREAPYQRSIASDYNKGDIRIRCNILDIVHGTLSPDNTSSFATLIVFGCSFYSKNHSRRATSVDVELVFNGISPEAPDPEVIKVVPEGKHCLMPEMQHKTVSYGFTGRVNAPIFQGCVGPEVSLVWQKVIVREEKSYTTVIGEQIIYGKDQGEDNGAAWTLLENPITKDGVPEAFRGAVLLKRRDATSHFQCDIKITAKTDRWTKLFNFFESQPLDDPILFNPQMPSTNNLRTYMVDRLGEIRLEEFEDIIMMKSNITEI